MAMTMGQLASKFHEAARRVDPVTEKRVAALAQVAVGEVKRQIQAVHAVDTSTMLNSTRADKVGRKAWMVGPTVDYAIFVALGTSRVAARPFHITAAKSLQGKINQGNLLRDLGL